MAVDIVKYDLATDDNLNVDGWKYAKGESLFVERCENSSMIDCYVDGNHVAFDSVAHARDFITLLQHVLDNLD
jgi:hypothetical protein